MGRAQQYVPKTEICVNDVRSGTVANSICYNHMYVMYVQYFTVRF